MPHPVHFFSAVVLCIASTATADQVFTDDVIITKGLCVGDDCVNNEVFDLSPIDGVLRLKANKGIIDFVDTSNSSNPDRDWRLHVNETSGGAFSESFFLEDVTSGRNPFYVEGNSPDNALRVASSGEIGLGTSLPQKKLHLVSTSSTTIRLEQTDTPYSWDMVSSNLGFHLADISGGSIPWFIWANAPAFAFTISQNGNIGLGTNFPTAPLELRSSDSFNFFRITAQGAAVNDSVDITYTGGPLGTGQLRYNIVETGDTPQVPEMTLDVDGNVVLTGTLTTTGPTCAGGCDRVFDAGYDLPEIGDHAAEMFAKGHLPSLTPTAPNQPVNVTEKMGEVINALEHAHIYINQLDQALQAERASNHALQATVDALLARVTLLEQP